jgi:hypothetical protein
VAGINRVHWDLRGESTRDVRLRSTPLYQPFPVPGPDGRPSGIGRLNLLSPPGTYTVKVSVAGKDLTQPLVVRKDPHSAGTEADIEAQMALLREVWRDLDAGAAAVDRIEGLRQQLASLARVVDDAEVRKTAGEVGRKLVDLEMNLHDLRLTGGQDGVRFEAKLLSKLNYLASGLASGDFKPTDQQVEVQKILADELRGHLGALDALIGKDIASLNDLLRSRNVPNIVTRSR